MTQKFQASVQHRGDVSYVKLAGVIDEDNELGELVDKIPTGTAVIDLGEIQRCAVGGKEALATHRFADHVGADRGARRRNRRGSQ